MNTHSHFKCNEGEFHHKLLKKLIGHSTTEINKTFLIKLSGVRNSIKYHNLVGVTGLINAIGIDLTRKFLSRAFKMDKENGKEVCKLRSGLKVLFYYK